MGDEEKRWDPIKNIPAFASEINAFMLVINCFLKTYTRPANYLVFGLIGVVLGTWGLWRAKKHPEWGGKAAAMVGIFGGSCSVVLGLFLTYVLGDTGRR